MFRVFLGFIQGLFRFYSGFVGVVFRFCFPRFFRGFRGLVEFEGLGASEV